MSTSSGSELKDFPPVDSAFPRPPAEPAPKAATLGPFFAILLVLAVVRVAVILIDIPTRAVWSASAVVSVVFVATPILALFRGAAFPWNVKRALAMLAGGALTQFAIDFLLRSLHVHSALVGGSMMAVAQTGLICWCLGLGALVATAVKDRNMLVPIAVFLALFDFWLVFVPEGFAGQEAHGSQETLRRVAYQVPQFGHAESLAYIGPADFLFLAMFFVALFRFHMRTKATSKAMIPTLVLYLLTVLVFGNVQIGPITLGALPALIPIGAVVLAVNWREFRLTRDELIATGLIAALGVGLVAWRMNAPPPPPPPETQAGPLPPGSAPRPKAPPGSRERLQQV